jgi:hypothetical protein
MSMGQVLGLRILHGFLSFQFVAVEIDAAQQQQTLTVSPFKEGSPFP